MSVVEMDKSREKGQVKGMAISKKAVEGMWTTFIFFRKWEG